MSIYTAAHIIHPYYAIVFMGEVFFGMLIPSIMHTERVSHEARREMGRTMSYRAVRVIPPVVTVLFLPGLIVVLDRYTDILRQPLASSFGTLLVLKILLIFSVLVHFAIAVVKMHRRIPTVGWSKYIHAAVFTHMLLTVLLAKGMFYLFW